MKKKKKKKKKKEEQVGVEEEKKTKRRRKRKTLEEKEKNRGTKLPTKDQRTDIVSHRVAYTRLKSEKRLRGTRKEG